MNFDRRQILGTAVGAGVVVASSASSALANRRTSAGHVILLGDSIFDNKRYVGNQPAVIDQVRGRLPGGWDASLLAVDGSVTSDVSRQLRQVPASATHLVLSVGGNDALQHTRILTQPARSAMEVFLSLAEIRENFRSRYDRMLRSVLALRKPTVLCTVYDPNFGDGPRQRMSVTALSVFNDTIYRAAAKYHVPLIDLRLVFTSSRDYANPIEPSPAGGAKMAAVIRSIVTQHDFRSDATVVYS